MGKEVKGHRGDDEASGSHDLHVMDGMSADGSAGRSCWASALMISARVSVKDSVGA
jgi:hypothetical protein